MSTLHVDRRTPQVKALIEQLVRARKDVDITQGVLIERLHISQATLSHWESGYRLPDLNKLMAWAAEVGQEVTIGVSDLRKAALEELARRHPGEFEALMLAERYRQGGEGAC